MRAQNLIWKIHFNCVVTILGLFDALSLGRLFIPKHGHQLEAYQFTISHEYYFTHLAVTHPLWWSIDKNQLEGTFGDAFKIRLW
jgi:hypothetical protein